jgi:2-polyprenyl-6-methoxyphenol hydroxylase-like FAD-dependent oxidoreductase
MDGIEINSIQFGASVMKVVIVGGVTGGAFCAARLRRLDENAAASEAG